MQPVLDLVRQVAAKYPAVLTHEQCALIVNEVAWLAAQRDPNWGISAKPRWKNARLPNGTLIAEDVLHHRAPTADNPHGQIVDILAGAPDRNEPVWIVQPYHGDPSGRPWLPAVDPATFAPTPAPGPTPPPVSAGPTLADVLARVETVAQRLDLLAHNSTLTAEGVQRLEAAMAAGIPLRLRAKLIGDVTGTVGGPPR